MTLVQEKIWQRAVEEAQGNSADVFDDVWGQENRQEDVHRLVTRDYAFQEDNPYLEHAHPFEEVCCWTLVDCIDTNFYLGDPFVQNRTSDASYLGF